MTQRQKRSVFARLLGFHASSERNRREASRTSSLAAAAGRLDHGAELKGGFESLEPRVLLAGDHASLPDFAAATFVDLASGSAFDTGTIDIDMGMVDPGDLFRFTAPATDFVRVLADSRNIPTSMLDTRIEIFNAAGDLIGESSDSGSLTAGTPTDAFFGFVAEAGEDYFVHVMSEVASPTDPMSVGDYILRLDTNSIALDVATNGVLIPQGSDTVPVQHNFMGGIFFGVDPVTGVLGADDPANPGTPFNLDDEVFVFTVPENDGTFANAVFGTLATASAADTEGTNADSDTMNVDPVDTRIEIFDAQGVLLELDSLSAFQTDPFTTFTPEPGETFYIRVRSDEFTADFAGGADFNSAESTGEFLLDVDLAPRDMVLNPVTRVFDSRVGPTGFGSAFFDPDPTGVDSTTTLIEFTSDVGFFSFTAVGDGQAFITVDDRNGMDAASDFQVSIFGPDGSLIQFIDDVPAQRPEIVLADLEGGERYFVIVNNFDQNFQNPGPFGPNGQYGLVIEASHTNNTSSDIAIDDHIDTPALDGSLTIDELREQFELATALAFGELDYHEDLFGNPQIDTSYFVESNIQGRINENGDSDLFQFVPQTDMLGQFAGVDSGIGTGVFVGGSFTVAGGGELPVPFSNDDAMAIARPDAGVLSNGVVIHDAGSFFHPGWSPAFTNSEVAPNLNALEPEGFGFFNNENTPLTDGPEIYAIYEVPAGIFSSQPALVIGGDFELRVPNRMFPGSMPADVAQNLAIYFFDDFSTVPNISDEGFAGGQQAFAWAPFPGIATTDAPVRAFELFTPDDEWDPDPNVDDDEIDLPDNQQLVIAGDFTDLGTSVVSLDLVDGTLFDIGALAGITPGQSVNALAVYDPAQPPSQDSGMGMAVEITDLPNSIFIGGDFTTNFTSNVTGGTITQDDLILFTGQEVETPFIGQSALNVNFGGSINALQVHNTGFEDLDDTRVTAAATFTGQAPESFVGDLLYIAGDLSGATINGGASGENIYRYGWVPSDAFDPLNSPERLNIDPLIGGPDGEVFALETYTPAALAQFGTGFRAGEDAFARPMLVAGGNYVALTDGTPVDFANIWDGAIHEPLGMGGDFDGPVFALDVVSDNQEPGISPVLGLEQTREVLYLGGDFDSQNNFARYDILPFGTFGVQSVGDTLYGPLEGNNGAATGVNGTVFALADFDESTGSDQIWDRNQRRSSRAQIRITQPAEAFGDAFLRIYDSNFNLIYTNDTVDPFGQPDPAGANNPSIQGTGANQAFEAPPMWAGETYYIEVTSSGTGRYDLSVQIDAVPTDNEVPGNGSVQNLNLIHNDPQDPFLVGFGGVQLLTLDVNGDQDLAVGVSFNNDQDQNDDVRGNDNRDIRDQPSLINSLQSPPNGVPPITGFLVPGNAPNQLGDLGLIQTIDDVDVYRFTAPSTGEVELWLQTLGLNDQYDEYLLDGVLNNTYDSPLDGLLRVYNNDLEQIAFNDDNGVVVGNRQEFEVGGLGTFEFDQQDSRTLFNAIAGETYFVVVESGQRYADGTAEMFGDRDLKDIDDVDRRFAIGSYNLLINATPSESIIPGDDHVDTGDTNATPINIGPDGRSILGLFLDENGTIDQPEDDIIFDGTVDQIGDIDLFRFVAPGSGIATITVERATGSDLIPTFAVVDSDGNLVSTASATSEGIAVDTGALIRGETYILSITGVGPSVGRYTITLDTVVTTDDFANIGSFEDAQPIELFDFQGGGSIDGSIEFQGDTDLFTFRAFTTQEFTITVSPNGASSLDPTVLVYEVGETLGTQNPLAPPPVFPTSVYKLIGASDDVSIVDFSAQVTVPVQADRLSPVTGEAFNDYFIVVRGQDPDFDIGDYTVTIDFPPSDDHADFAELQDPLTRSLSTFVVINPADGTAQADGVIELSGDTDVFQFSPPAGGRLILNLATPSGSALGGVMTVFTLDNNILTQVATTAPGGATILDFEVDRSTPYFLVVDGTDMVVPNAEDVGGYSVSFTGPALDDHANSGEFTLATFLTLDEETGDAQVGTGQPGANPTIDPPVDGDLFTFVTIGEDTGSDPLTVTVTPQGGGLGLRPTLTIFDASQTQVAQTSTAFFDTPISISLPGVGAGERFFVLVEDTFAAAPAGAEYVLNVDSAPGTGSTPDDPDFIDFSNPDEALTPSSIRGDAEAFGAIDEPDDRDLYTYTAAADGTIFVQVTTPDGSPLDAQIFIYDAPSEDPSGLVASDSEGRPGATADLAFEGVGGTTYFIVVDGVGAGTGAYTVRIDGVSPDVFTGVPEIDSKGFNHRIYFPEGFVNPNVREFISIANSNAEDVNFSIILRYQFASPRDFVVVQDGVIGAGARSGVTLSNGSEGQFPGLLSNEPYAVEIVSDAPLAANVSHYDFNSSTGEAFTEELASEWTFARVERAAGLVRDFVLYYNPHPFDVRVTLTAEGASGPVSVTRIVPAFRRGGLDINAQSALPTGIFGAELTAEPVNAANAASFEGIVASLTHFDIAGQSGFALLGDPDGGSRAGAITSLERGDVSTAEIVIYNPSDEPATVDIEGQYIRAALPDLVRRVQVAPNSTLVLTGDSLNLINNQPIGFEYTSDRDVSVVASESQLGDANAVLATTEVGTQYFIGDAFIGFNNAGTLYFEELSFYNPAQTAQTIAVQLLFANGLSQVLTVDVGARDFAEIILHENEAFLDNPDRTRAFAINVVGTLPFGFSFEHYDLFIEGGWGSNGAPIGLLNEISSILV